MTLVAICASHHQKNPAGVPLARPIVIAQMIDHRTAPRRLQNFFLSTSCSIVLSRLRSATNCFNRLFSSWSCFI
jgi:hypothetical protein